MDIKEVMTKIKEVMVRDFPEHPLPIIAGGAVRDGFLEEDIKDYDVFFDKRGFENFEDFCTLLGYLALGSLTVTSMGQRYQKRPDFEVYSVSMWNIETPTPEIQFIGHETNVSEDPAKFVDTFNTNLSKCWMNHNLEYFFLDEAKKGFEEKIWVAYDAKSVEKFRTKHRQMKVVWNQEQGHGIPKYNIKPGKYKDYTLIDLSNSSTVS